MKLFLLTPVVGLLLASVVTGCGGAQTGGGSGSAGDDVAFDELSEGKQAEYMQRVVVPAMTRVFQASPEPEHFPKVTCETCHGSGARQGNFEMPSADLPKLGSFEHELEEHPEMTRYMADRVVPEMAKLLKEQPFDPKTQRGFGCFDCHMKE